MSVNFVNSGISSQSIDTSWPSRDSEIHIRYFDVRILVIVSLSLRIHWCNEKTHQVRDSILNDLSPFYFSLEFWNNCHGGRLLDKGRLLVRASNTNIVAIEAFFRQETFFWEGGGGGGQLYNLRYVKISYINVPHHCCTWQLLKMYVLPKIVKKTVNYIQSNHPNKTPLYHRQFSNKILTIFPLKR